MAPEHSVKVVPRFRDWLCDSPVLPSAWTRPRKFLQRSSRASPKPPNDCCRWFTTNFAISPPPGLPAKLPDKPSKPPLWCTRPGSNLPARIVGSGRGAPISSPWRPRPCAASLSTTLDARKPVRRGGHLQPVTNAESPPQTAPRRGEETEQTARG